MREAQLKIALATLVKAVGALAERNDENKTYFEAPPMKDKETMERWLELNRALANAKLELG